MNECVGCLLVVCVVGFAARFYLGTQATAAPPCRLGRSVERSAPSLVPLGTRTERHGQVPLEHGLRRRLR
jgi:hypothetical protein